MKVTGYVLVILGLVSAFWAQLALHDDAWILRIVLTIIGIAVAGSAYEIVKKAKKADK